MGGGTRLLAICAVLGAVLSGTAAVGAQSAQPVPALDLSRFTGTWYELARLPNKAEKRCVGNALILYGLEDKNNHFSAVTTCSLKDDTPQVRNQSGKRPGKLLNGRLETSYFVLLHHQTWVLAVDPDYQWALVGSPNHKTLWFYSRTMTLAPAAMEQMRAAAVAQGFHLDTVVPTPQTNPTRRREVVKPNGAVSTGVAP